MTFIRGIREAAALWLILAAAVCAIAQPAPDRAVAEREDGGTYVNFNFDQVDVRSFIKLVGDMAGIRFVVDEDVAGKVTVSAPRIAREDAYGLFVSILESVGCTVVEDGTVHRVIRLAERETPSAPVVGVGEAAEGEGLITKVFRLEHVSVSQFRPILESTVGGGKIGAVGALEESNHLIITDTARSIKRIEKIVSEIDRPGMARVTEVVPLKFASSEDLAGQLNMAMEESQTRAQRLRGRLPAAPGRTASVVGSQDVVVVPSPHSNSLILVGTRAQIDQLRELVAKMDVDVPSGRGRFNAIFLKYLNAEDAAKSINSLLEKSFSQEKNGGDVRRIAIESSPPNNAILVDASPQDFDIVHNLVEQLDHVMPQVHIDVLIAELSIGDTYRLGVEFAALEKPSDYNDTVLQGSSSFSGGADSLMNTIQEGLFPRGITIGAAQNAGTDGEGKLRMGYPAVLNLDAIRRNTRFRVLSETALETQNNQEASVRIVNEIPILKSTIEGGAGTARDVIQNIERVDVGIELKLTPHVIPDGKVRMVLNPSIEAVIDSGSGETQFTPTIARREVETTVTVPDGETIVIAGLTREDTTTVEQRVPILGYIPILGYLFRHHVDTTEKVNLMIFVKPRIVTDMAESDEVMNAWTNKTGITAQ